MLTVLVLTAAVVFAITIAWIKISNPALSKKTQNDHLREQICDSAVHLLVVLGSGGHTEEMLSMLRHAQLDPAWYNKRTYLVSSGDSFSARKAVEFERDLQLRRSGDSKKNINNEEIDSPASYVILTVPRARKVHQSFLTAPLSTLQCFGFCLLVLLGRHPDQLISGKSMLGASLPTPGYPDIILTNGPGMGVCVVVAAKLLRMFDHLFSRVVPSRRRMKDESGRNRARRRYLRTIFIESWARVTTLSLSGKILLPLVDRFLVQWESLVGYSGLLGGKTEYVGTLLS